MDLLREYNEILEIPVDKFARIRRKKVENDVYYFELGDLSYISVVPNMTYKVYDCTILDGKKDYKEGKYNFNIPFEYVIQAGSFEAALENVYNRAVRSVVTGGLE